MPSRNSCSGGWGEGETWNQAVRASAHECYGPGLIGDGRSPEGETPNLNFFSCLYVKLSNGFPLDTEHNPHLWQDLEGSMMIWPCLPLPPSYLYILLPPRNHTGFSELFKHSKLSDASVPLHLLCSMPLSPNPSTNFSSLYFNSQPKGLCLLEGFRTILSKETFESETFPVYFFQNPFVTWNIKYLFI